MKKEKIIVISLIIILIVIMVGVTYAVFSYSKVGERINSITTGAISMEYTESDNIISMNKALPTTDATGKVRLTEGEYFDFTVKGVAGGNSSINYEIGAEEVGEGTIDGSNIKLYLTEIGSDGGETEVMSPKVYSEEVEENTYTGRPSGVMSLTTGTKTGEFTTKYRLRMYVTEEYNPQGDGGGLTFSIKVNVYGKEGESIIQINEPELDNGLIAVRYESNNWVKADTTNNNWYNYDEGEWANAVTVTSTSLETYKSADAGTVINMDDIETMWVWIPRYSYTIGSEDGVNYYGKKGEYLTTNPTLSLPGEIDIRFINKTKKDRGSAKYKVSEGYTEDSWYTPDAFTFGNEELKGLWVSKFAVSSSVTTEGNCGNGSSYINIKPNKITWRCESMSNMHNNALKLTKSGNSYGLSTDMNSHLMKNSEWGVVAYLSQSKYGKLGNPDYSGKNKQVYANNDAQLSAKAGCSQGPSLNYDDCKYTYDVNLNGTGASTTGTIYGIYDMVYNTTNLWVAVMGYVEDTPYPDDSGGFNTMPDLKYYDNYNFVDYNMNTLCNGGVCLSHALSETEDWYGGRSNFPDEFNTWSRRGGDSSIFSVDAFDGEADYMQEGSTTFHFTMSPTK